MESATVQSTAILAAVVVFLLRQIMDAYKLASEKVSNGKHGSVRGGKSGSDMIRELHGWHKPVRDAKTGQHRFPQLNENTEEMLLCLKQMNSGNTMMINEIKELRLVIERQIDG